MNYPKYQFLAHDQRALPRNAPNAAANMVKIIFNNYRNLKEVSNAV